MPRAPHRVQDARAGVRRLLEREAGFVGTGITLVDQDFAVLVLVEAADCAAALRAPSDYRGVPVRVEVSGTPRAS